MTTPPRRSDFLMPFLMVVSDGLAIEVSFLVAYWLRFVSPVPGWLRVTPIPTPPILDYLLGSLFIIAAWLLIFGARKMYRPRRAVEFSDELVSIAKVVTLGMLIAMSAAFFYRGFSYSRSVFALLWVCSVIMVFCGRALLISIERRAYRRGRQLQRAIIIGGNGTANEVFARLNRHPSFGFLIEGYFASRRASRKLPLFAATYLGAPSAAPSYIRKNRIDLCFIALRSSDHPALFELIDACEGVNIDFMMVPDVLEVLTSQMKLQELEGVPFLKIKSVPFTTWGRISKRAFDVAISTTILLVLSPLMLVIAAAIRIDSRGPVFFVQQRVGLDGKPFMMLKFRSMREGAEKLDGQAGLGIHGDPRRTRVGSFLRKASLDELPQLYNVLRGDMSLVGPRPERVQYVREFQRVIPNYVDRHRVKTGVTGWAQVNGLRGDTSIEERIRYDIYYIENWSLALDVRILLRTLRSALSFHQVD